MERRLAAILAADFAGYSARVEANEDATVRAVRGHLDALELVVGLHRGRVVKTMGDGMLVEFASVVDAVSCAAAMQARMAERNADLARRQGFDLRIGVHVGDILIDQGDIFGDGVNIAARIEALAEPGGVVVTGRVHEDTIGRLDLAFRDLGDHQLKNIARPVRLFALDPDRKPQTGAPQRHALPDKPSLAVLPLVNHSSDRENDYVADGLTEDIIAALAHIPWMFVIARNSTFAYKGAAVDVRKVGRDLGVRYVMEGSLRAQGDRIRVTGQLIDAETGAHIWADRFDGSTEDIFALQDRITEAVAAAIGPGVQTAEIERVRSTPPANLNAYDHYLRARAALNRAQIAEAVEHLDQAITAAPTYAKAIAIRAWCCTLQLAWTAHSRTEDAKVQGIELSRRALDLDRRDLEVVAHAGYTLGFFGADDDRGFDLLCEATDGCPSYAWAWTSRAMLDAVQGDAVRALDMLEVAHRLNPRDPQFFRHCIAKSGALSRLERWAEARDAAQAGLRDNPTPAILYLHAISALVHLGQLDEAKATAKALLDRHPEFRAESYLKHLMLFRMPKIREPIKAAMKAVGLLA